MFFTQVLLLLWKNFILHFRKPLMTFLECLLPTLFAFVILTLRFTSEKETKAAIDYPVMPERGRLSVLGFLPESPATTDVIRRALDIHYEGRTPPGMYRGFAVEKEAVAYFEENSDTMTYIIKFLDIQETDQTLPKHARYLIRPYRKINQIWHTGDVFPFEKLQIPRNDMGDYPMVYVQTLLGRAVLQHWLEAVAKPNQTLIETSSVKKQTRPETGGGGEQNQAFTEKGVGQNQTSTGTVARQNQTLLETGRRKRQTQPDTGAGNSSETGGSGGGEQNRTAPNFQMSFLRYPSPSYVVDQMYVTVKMQLTLFMVLGFMLIAFVDTKNIVQEKELKIKESMKLMGMGLPAYWLSWFLTCFFCLMPSLILYTVILGVDVSGKGSVLPHSDPSIVFVQLLCYSLALISFTFMISCFVQKGNDGAIAAGLLFLIEYVPYEILSPKYKALSWNKKMASCLLFNVALGLTNFNIVRREAIGEGIQWDNVNEPLEPGDITIVEILVMLLVDTVLHLLVTWYLDNVFPGEYGVPKPPHFFLMRSYWCGGHRKPHETNRFDCPSVEKARNFERAPDGYPVGIEIINLRKEFADKVSVANLTLNMYKGQITVLLGHNGAGKTTTMSMLTGFSPPTEGTAIINGYNIQQNIDGVRRSLGLCPQHDILFDDLTPREHLWFFAKLKGYRSATLHAEIREMLGEVGLKKNSSLPVSKMSGGQKRSLSVGIALMGDSKVVFLDEPSSGMDPSTRRHTWDLLKNRRRDRTLVLSTHYMDEADALGDRIAIMANGELLCCGTSMFLKKLYGAGYHLVIECVPRCDVVRLTLTIVSFISSAQLESVVRTEVSYLLPDTTCAQFPALFRHLSANKQKLGVISFGTTTTTMEEVFLRSEKRDPDTMRTDLYNTAGSYQGAPSVTPLYRHRSAEYKTDPRRYSGPRLWMAQFKALFVKRTIITTRHWATTLLTYTLPAIFLLIYIFIDTAVVKDTDKVEPSLLYDLDMYGHTRVLYIEGAGTGLLGDTYRDLVNRNHVTEEFPDVPTQNLSASLLEKIASVGQYRFNKQYIVGVKFSRPANTTQVLVLYNGEPHHALYVATDLVLNTFVRVHLGPSYHITTGNHPLPKKGDSELAILVFESLRSSFFVGLFIGIGMALYASLVVHYLLRERETGVKHMHALFGVSMLMYWLPTFLWDALSFVVPTILLFLVFSFFDKREFLDDKNWLLILLVISCYVWSMLPATYAVHFLFDTPSSGLVGVVIMNLFALLLSDILVFEFQKPQSTNKSFGKIFDWVFSAFIPSFNLSQCFGFILRNHNTHKLCQPLQPDCERGIESLCCVDHPEICKSPVPDSQCFEWSTTYTEWDKDKGIGTYLLFMIVQGLLGFLIIFVVEFGTFRKIGQCCVKCRPLSLQGGKPRQSVDEEDVLRERTQILNSDSAALSETMPLLMVNLHKKYGNTEAVDHICAGVPYGECFGLLGQSGAGKTTVFRMLTGETNVTSGNAYLKGYSVRTNLKMAQSHIGYCPQFDAHICEMTGQETLTMYARLRGIHAGSIPSLVDNLIERVLLGPHANRVCGTYSGGNKRKLSLAMALVGDPPFLFLDEPSSGMDPKARRQIWNVLSDIRASGRTIVLTSHSMEECDALCTRLAIMLKGGFMCMGSPQHLKSKYGQGYTVIVKMGCDEKGQTTPGQTVVEFIQKSIPDTTVFDEHPGYLHLQIPSSVAGVADVFSVMETCKLELGLEDYSVHETSLEQIFLTFTKLQDMEEEDGPESCWFLQAGFFDDKLLCF
ncbi:ATP-binding cassette sub-family A member 3 [Aplysia californica]|uniref:ATP-binding cassette sub-family A member 3 n=1 Tax=Aplysia californica TaxID=6500 RepID=A0ABM1A985_APLCA|nr:ATP-binding cassette sub-family A member 3 [Aplysia californica]